MYSLQFAPMVFAILMRFGFALPGNSHLTSSSQTAAVLASLPILERQSADNTCGHHPDHRCIHDSPGGGPCCSAFGWCGHGPAYCGQGCQPQFGECKTKHNQHKHCGPKHNNKKCDGGDCCSKNGICGSGEAFCGKHCQAGFGYCPVPQQPAPKPMASQKPLPQPAETQGKRHLCGKDHSNGVCPYPQCCSAAGYCGIGGLYCSVPDNCQETFGFCESQMIPQGLNTSAEVRDHESKVPYGKLINKCDKPRTVALTFDDGPAEHTEQILNLLRDYKAHATFFITANNNGKGQIDVNPRWVQIIKRMAMEGHQIGSHTWSHPDMDKTSSHARKNEMWKTERAIANIIGRFPAYTRAPYLKCSSDTGCMKDLDDLGYHVVGYEVDSGDWRKEETLDTMKARIDRSFGTKSKDENMVIIQHDHSKWSIELTKHILDKAVEKGWTAETIGSCLQDPDSIWYHVPRGTSLQSIAPGGCVLAAPGFCGTIEPFHNKATCYKSAQACMRDAQSCAGNLGSDKIACKEFKHICKIHNQHCTGCPKDQCHSLNWIFDRKEALKTDK